MGQTLHGLSGMDKLLLTDLMLESSLTTHVHLFLLSLWLKLRARVGGRLAKS